MSQRLCLYKTAAMQGNTRYPERHQNTKKEAFQIHGIDIHSKTMLHKQLCHNKMPQFPLILNSARLAGK